MRDQMVVLRKAAAAYAMEGFLPRVYPHVHRQVGVLQETPQALAALKRTLARVCAPMKDKGPAIRKTSHAPFVLTFERLVCHVRPPVPCQIWAMRRQHKSNSITTKDQQFAIMSMG
jgi:hypothetical protein